MTHTVSDLLTLGAMERFVGRVDELSLLDDLIHSPGTPLVMHVHGIAGIGKSALLARFSSQARSLGIPVVALDCRAVEPTEPAFLQALGAALELDHPTIEQIANHLSQAGERVVITLDHYEVFLLLDTWLRQVFLPRLPGNVRVILAGREQPAMAWLTALEWQGLFRSLTLGPLADREAQMLLVRNGVPEAKATQINRVARGHPLAIMLAARAAADRPQLDIGTTAVQAVVDELARLFLEEVSDPLTREALEASSVIRRTTRSLLQRMLPTVDAAAAFERLQTLPFVERDRDGLIVHDAVREAIAAALRATDPVTHRNYRRAAWQQLRDEVREAGHADLWRYTADMLYLIEHPVVREAFFPSDPQSVVVEPARPADGLAILAIARTHEGPRAAAQFEMWWSGAPESFSVVRDRAGAVVGFYCMFDPASVPADLLRRDPLTAAWSNHLQRDPIPSSQRALFFRRWLSADTGELPSAAQAACWLDVKRNYMELRPELRRIYATAQDAATYAPILLPLGFQLLADAGAVLDDLPFHTVLLDFGPASVDGWLAGLVAAELGMDACDDSLLDIHGRELVVDDARVRLSRLEFDLISYLQAHRGEVIARSTLLDKVWGQDFEGGSNVVDVTVLSLRRKLGSRAPLLETVRGVGYRLRNP